MGQYILSVTQTETEIDLCYKSQITEKKLVKSHGSVKEGLD